MQHLAAAPDLRGRGSLRPIPTEWAERVFTVYEDAASAEAAQSTVRSVWSGMADYFAAGPDAREFSTAQKIAG